MGWTEFHMNAFWQLLSLVNLYNWLRTSCKLSISHDCNRRRWQPVTVDCSDTGSWENRLLSWWLLPKDETPESVSVVEREAVRALQSWVSYKASSWSPLWQWPLDSQSPWKNLLYSLLSIMSIVVSLSGNSLQSLCHLIIFCLSSFSQALEECRLRKALKLWHQKYLMLMMSKQSPQHSHRAVYEEPLAVLFCEERSTSSGFHSSAPTTLASQSSLEKVRKFCYRSSLCPLCTNCSEIGIFQEINSASTWYCN